MAKKVATLRELEPSTGTVTADELFDLLDSFAVKLTDEVQFPLTVKLSKQHALHVEKRASQRVTEKGLVDLYNWNVTENMATSVRRE